MPDILQTVTRWIESRGSAAPAVKDAAKVKTYLLKCVEESSGVSGLDSAVEVMKWMRVILLERWDEEDAEQREEGREWWRVWREFHEGLDGVCWKRYGAGLRL
jgi:DNA repair protein REV1